MKIIYWVFVLLACVVATSVAENSTSFTKERNTTTLIRTKRFEAIMWTTTATKSTFRVIASEVEAQLKHALHGSGKNVNQKIIRTEINQLWTEKNIMKHLLARNPSWGKHLIFDIKGLKCDTEFCKKYGNDYYGFGICDTDLCHCSFGKAQRFKCLQNSLVYNPIYRDCDFPRNVMGCGET